MAFSTGFGLTCMCFIMLLFLPGQGQRQCTKGKPPKVGNIPIDCCTETSNATISEPVDACYEQKKDFRPCKIHAYIFVTKSNKQYCVDPRASWLTTRLEKLKKKGIICKDLVKSLHQPK
ncbi:C-C motif chemokine 2-like isoform X1 [Thunnus albacares]|uniref:C-C motif chemokine 2-like isoform X1 n=1 Tax=Thunnus albacares TaxID=8236 RepID=UPI001CF65457|nr:C-C motif chemokine 2-like isoform X1 [Thunnus albacares]